MKEKGTIAMEGEGSIEYQDLQQILDNFAKEQEEKGNKNTPTTTMVALPIWDNISNALDQWLQSISILEERQKKAKDLRERINRKLGQVQQDGLISIYDFGTLTYIGQVWVDLINLLSSCTDATVMDKDVKQLILKNLFQLYNMQQISYELIMKIIIQL